MSSEYAPDAFGGNPYGEPAPRPRNGLAVVALVVGVVALLLSWIVVGLPLAILGLVLSIVALRRVRRGAATNRGVAVTGLVLNIVSLVISVVLTVLIVAAGSFFWNNGGQDLTDCLSNAGNDQAAVQQCQQDFADQFDSATNGS